MTPFNRTKIVATLGPASASRETVSAMIRAGVDVIRLNFSHGTYSNRQLSHLTRSWPFPYSSPGQSNSRLSEPERLIR